MNISLLLVTLLKYGPIFAASEALERRLNISIILSLVYLFKPRLNQCLLKYYLSCNPPLP